MQVSLSVAQSSQWRLPDDRKVVHNNLPVKRYRYHYR